MSNVFNVDILFDKFDTLERRIALLEQTVLGKNPSSNPDNKNNNASSICDDFEVSEGFQGVIIQKYIGPEKSEIYIPHEFGGLPVVEIGKEAFKNCVNMKIVVMPDTIKRIGVNAFYGCGLREVSFPSGLMDIDDRAFMMCKYILSIDIPDSVKRIGENAFYGCSFLKRVKLPKHIKVCEKGTFDKCERFLYIDIPNNVEIIKNHAFNHQISTQIRETKHIRIPDSVSHIERYAFGSFNGYIVIYCNMGSAALKFARENDFRVMDYEKFTSVIKE